jgi:oligosaccharyltransferase complex subunit alpha (ribophorin I)
MWKKSSILVLLAFVISLINVKAIDTDAENKNVERVIDLTTQLVKITYKITLSKATSNYVFSLPTEECDNVSFVSARDATKKDIKLTNSKTAKDCSYSMTLPAATTQFSVEAVFARALVPYPVSITQAERQLVRYFGSAYFYSPYKTLTQKTIIHLATGGVESFTQLKPSINSDKQIVYGPYENIARKLFFLHFKVVHS